MVKRIRKSTLITIIVALVVSLFVSGFAFAADYNSAIIKVGLNSPLRSSNPQVPYVTLANQAGFRIGQFNDNRAFSETAVLNTSSITVTAAGGGFEITDKASGQAHQYNTSKIAVMPISETAEGTTYTLPDKSYGMSAAYYGGFEFVSSSNGARMSIINYLNLESYVKGVLPYEMPASWHTEALKAQAVCIRTYAMQHLNAYVKYGFDVCNTTYSQAYGGVYLKDGTSYKNRTDAAVDSTAGVCILYNGNLIDAVYHAASGGATEDAVNVWGSSVPYLKAVVDSYEQTPSVYTYDGSFTAAEMYSKLKAKNPSFPLADIADISCTYTAAGNMLSVTFTDSSGKTQSYSKDECRTRVLGSFTAYTSLRFSIMKEPASEGTRYIVSSKGHGHNVGMSQYGAKGMADTGYTYGKIISQYYTGVTLSSSEATPGEALFTDVKESDWYYEAVKHCVAAGLFNGTSDTTFSPNDTMSRAMFVTVLHRYAGLPAYSFANSFNDVPAEQWFTDAIIWAAGNGIVNGVGGESFAPHSAISLEQMITVLYRYKGTVSSGAAPTQYGEISDYAVDAMAWAQRAGLLENVGGALSARGAATRAQVAAILMNFLS